MVIYSEILGKQFKTVEDCLAAEEQYNKKLKEEELRRKKEQEQAEKGVKEKYDTLVYAWMGYLKALDKAGYDVDGMEDKAESAMENRRVRRDARNIHGAVRRQRDGSDDGQRRNRLGRVC